MRDDVFSAVKAAVPVAEVVRFYGYQPNHAGFVCCPFHADKGPSLKLYNDGFHCFGCGAHGSVVDFVARLFDLDALGAVKRLNNDFRLGLDIYAPADPEALQQRQKAAEARQLFDSWRQRALDELNGAIRVANLADFDKLTDAEALAHRYREWLEDLADQLMHDDIEAQMAIYSDWKGVKRICRTILNSTPTRSSAA